MCSPPPIIYLSDSDEDTAADDEPRIIEETRNLWHIDYKDFLIANPVHGKFYRPRIWCSRCRKEGNHPVKLCHLPKYKICYICGGTGHLGQHCQNQHCKRCMDFHSTSKCNLNIREFKCRICSKYGHLDDVCPNHWRKFHNITDPQIDPDKTVTEIQKNTNKSCSICGRHQHYSFECDRLRNRSIEISSPYDIKTTFDGKFIPTRNAQSKTSRDYQEFLKRLNTAPTTPTTPTSTRKSFVRRPSLRYFDEANHSQFDQTNSYQPTTRVTFSPPPQPQPNNNNNKSPKKKPKTKKKKNKSKNRQPVNQKLNESDIIKGGSIRSGRVKKSKSKPQKKKQKRQQIKLEHELLRQSKQSNIKCLGSIKTEKF